MARSTVLSIVIFCLAFSSTVFAQKTVESSKTKRLANAAVATPFVDELTSTEIKAIDEAVTSEMKEQGVVGCAIGVLRNNKIVYLNGYGLANREKKIPVTNDTVFNWASNSKPLAAFRAMQLVEQGKLDLDADVRKYVPEFPKSETPILVRHLLTHQSGLPHYTNGQVVPRLKRHSATELNDPINSLDRFIDSPLLYKPGEKTSYSTYAYILLSAVIQRAGKEPFVTQIDQHIAKPLNLASLQTDLPDAKSNWATGYEKSKRADDRVIAGNDKAEYWKHGGGAYKSNIEDFAKWAEALLNKKLMKTATYQLFFTPQKATDERSRTYGLGIRVDSGKVFCVHHNGKQDEATSRLEVYPDEKFGIVVLANCDFADTTKIAEKIRAASTQKPRK